MSRYTWQSFSKEKGVELNDQYFLVYCETIEKTYEFEEELQDKFGFIGIPASGGALPSGPWIYANLNTKYMFIGKIGVNLLSGPVVGNHALTRTEFLEIVNIFMKYEGLSMLVFPK